MDRRQPYAWAVEFGKGQRAVLLDHARAEEYAARSHGVIVPLFDQRDAEEEACPPTNSLL